MSAALAQDWNKRLLEVLEKTYPYDAKLMATFTAEGERQNQQYAERLAEFRRQIEQKERLR